MALSLSRAARFSPSQDVRRRAQRLLEATSIAYGAPDILSLALGQPEGALFSAQEKQGEGLSASAELR
jgi:hypothetical protein